MSCLFLNSLSSHWSYYLPPTFLLSVSFHWFSWTMSFSSSSSECELLKDPCILHVFLQCPKPNSLFGVGLQYVFILTYYCLLLADGFQTLWWNCLCGLTVIRTSIYTGILEGRWLYPRATQNRVPYGQTCPPTAVASCENTFNRLRRNYANSSSM